MNDLRIAIAGAGGRMGRMLVEATLRDAEATLAAAIDQPDAVVLGKDAGELVGLPCGILVSSDRDAGIAQATCLIDFTRPEGTLEHLEICRRHGTAIVIGTTGFDAAGKNAIAAAAEDIPVVFAPNMSVGVNVVFKLLDLAARIMNEGYDIEIVEAHHRHKIDAPSGTALRMGEVVAQAFGRDLRQCAVYGREGVTGERLPSTIGFSTIRGGDIVGDHNVMFCGLGERVEIGHKASSRLPYALGSLRAARFLSSRSKGLFDMQDVLGLR
ncbi:dihydrodipicolinate reductase [Candidatus Accumulibacter aalborgensis]|uniref:4-hydroxy-tetrahydrodipicolinate reductase n=1 Tax=Candidatus Accumulibacter aalborgensis TaxID=1860102 RepID=A0A1A8XCW1_9PROT|nr:4-hydroxy-tetrahydrodipicolinate reductase [Candidatus Accumulibacter aalborgensis]SBT03050.1 dihydrodipicolinate reductase [Candidatus Accumulibacter aalborgensis]